MFFAILAEVVVFIALMQAIQTQRWSYVVISIAAIFAAAELSQGEDRALIRGIAGSFCLSSALGLAFAALAER